MNEPYYADDRVTLHHGDALAVLQQLPDASVDCCVTSPPYFGLRDYGTEGQYGLEASPAEYVETMRALFAEVRRVLTDDGTLWLNIGDSYYSGRGASGGQDDKQPARRGFIRSVDKPGQVWARPKSLLGIPWRTAFALVDDGWTLRNDIIWSKPNAMPESVTDRLSCRHEHVFMLTKSRSYHFDLDPIREPLIYPHKQGHRFGGNDPDEGRRRGAAYYPKGMQPQTSRGITGKQHVYEGSPLGRNPGDVWEITTRPFSGAHFAVMPLDLPERAILAGCKPGGGVLDPFSGSGTTGLAATKHGRKYVGIDLNANYLDLSLRTRFAEPGFDFGEAIS